MTFTRSRYGVYRSAGLIGKGWRFDRTDRVSRSIVQGTIGGLRRPEKRKGIHQLRVFETVNREAYGREGVVSPRRSYILPDNDCLHFAVVVQGTCNSSDGIGCHRQ